MLIITAKIGELYDKENGWILSLITGFLTLYPFAFLEFENDSLGFVLFFIALYFVLKGFKENRPPICKENILGIIFIILAGLTWKGSVYWLIAFSIISPIFLLMFLPMLYLYFEQFFWFTTATRLVQEHAAIVGIIYLGMTPFFLFGFTKMSKKEILMCCLMFIPVLFVQKLYVIAIPFISIVALVGLLSLKKYHHIIIPTIIVFSVFMAAFFGMNTYSQFPNPADMQVVEMAAQLTDRVENSFGIGYIAIHKGLQVSSFGGTYGNDYQCVGYVLEHPYINNCDCNIITESNFISLEKC
jgi:hypothetical protein